MTITMLMSNTVKAARLRRGRDASDAPSSEFGGGRAGCGNRAMRRMLRLGLTGGIASGKSAVAGMLRELGFAVMDADSLGHALIEPGKPAYEEVVRTFGPGCSGRATGESIEGSWVRWCLRIARKLRCVECDCASACGRQRLCGNLRNGSGMESARLLSWRRRCWWRRGTWMSWMAWW